MGAGKHRKIHDVFLTEKVIPLITGEITFGQHFCELVFGVNIFDLDFGSKLILSNNQSSTNLWVRDTCLIVALLSLTIILITASLASKMYSWASK